MAAMMNTDFSEMLESMGRFNDELIRAGVLVAAEGLDDANEGVVVDFAGDTPVVANGPYGETKELFLDVASIQEAVDWVKRAPMVTGSKAEIRRMPSIDEFPQDDEWVQKERAWREQTGQLRVGVRGSRSCRGGVADGVRPHRSAPRRRGARDERHALLARDLDEETPGPDALFDPDAIGDDVLTLMFTACHPLLSKEAQIALTLRLVGGSRRWRSRMHFYAALELTDAITGRGELAGTHLLPMVRGELFARLGRTAEARVEWQRAVELASNAVERAVIEQKLAALPPAPSGAPRSSP